MAIVITAVQRFFKLTFQKKNIADYPIYTKMEKSLVFLGAGEIHFTVRSDSNGKMRTIETTLEHIAHEVLQMNTAGV
jgi:hypothetical protein